MALPSLSDTSLVGGTALALLYGHRILRSLVYFDDADLELDPISLRECTWSVVKIAMENAVTKHLSEQV